MSGVWPGATRCVVMLSFDLDGVSALLNRDPGAARRPSTMSRFDFGPKVGVFRILDLLDRYDIRASFFIPGYIAERNEETVREVARRGHEIGHHGYMHEPPASVGPEEEQAILDRGTEILSAITGERPLGYRSPSWELSEHSLAYLADRGFVYDSSLMDHDTPYLIDTPKGRLVEVPVDWALDDAHYYAFARGAGSMNTPEDVYKAWGVGVRRGLPVRRRLHPDDASPRHGQAGQDDGAGAHHRVRQGPRGRRVHAMHRRRQSLDGRWDAVVISSRTQSEVSPATLFQLEPLSNTLYTVVNEQVDAFGAIGDCSNGY